MEQQKTHETVENTKYFVPTYESPRNLVQYQEYNTRDEPSYRYSESPADSEYARYRNQTSQNYANRGYVHYENAGETLYDTRGTSNHSPIHYEDRAGVHKIMVPTKYKKSVERHQINAVPESDTHRIYPSMRGTNQYQEMNYFPPQTPHSESPRTQHGFIETVIVPNSNGPTKVTHQDKDKRSKNYSKYQEGIGYRKYETGVKTKEKSSKSCQEYTPEYMYGRADFPYFHNQNECYGSSRKFSSFHQERPTESIWQGRNYEAFERPSTAANDYMSYDSEVVYHPKPPSSRYHEVGTARSSPGHGNYELDPRVDFGNIHSDRNAHHVTFAPTPDMQRTPSQQRFQQPSIHYHDSPWSRNRGRTTQDHSLKARIDSATTQSTYRDQYRSPTLRYQAKDDHEVLSRCMGY